LILLDSISSCTEFAHFSSSNQSGESRGLKGDWFRELNPLGLDVSSAITFFDRDYIKEKVYFSVVLSIGFTGVSPAY